MTATTVASSPRSCSVRARMMTPRYGGLGRVEMTARRLRPCRLGCARMMMTRTERLGSLGYPPMRTMMMSDVQSIDSLATKDGHGASISEKPWADTAPDDQHGEVDEAVAKLGEVLREALVGFRGGGAGSRNQACDKGAEQG